MNDHIAKTLAGIAEAFAALSNEISELASHMASSHEEPEDQPAGEAKKTPAKPPQTRLEPTPQENPDLSLADLQDLGGQLLTMGRKTDLLAVLETYSLKNLSSAPKDQWSSIYADLEALADG
jgi:hypothetical protein